MLGVVAAPEVFPPPSHDVQPMLSEIYARIHVGNSKLADLTEESHPLVTQMFRVVLAKFQADPAGYLRHELSRYGLAPGQELARPGGFGMESVYHHGIYMGDGLVAEVGALTCPIYVKKLMAPWRMNQQCFGLSTVREFDEVAVNSGFQLKRVQYDGMDDYDLDVIRARLERLGRIFQAHSRGWQYNPFVNNCQHASSSVAAGVCASRQIPWDTDRVTSTLMPLPRRRVFDSALANCGACHYLPVSREGCACIGPVQRGWSGVSWCLVDPHCPAAESAKRTAADQPWDHVPSPKRAPFCREPTRGAYRPCRSPGNATQTAGKRRRTGSRKH